MNILLVEPSFPIPRKSKNHKNFLPIGLLKIATYLRSKNHHVKLVRGTPSTVHEVREIESFDANEVWITSLFAYWADYVRDTVGCYRVLFPGARIVVGGIYASLFPADEVKAYTGCDQVYQGVMREAEEYPPAYELIDDTNGHPIDYQIIHASRGCVRKCKFCGTHIIEPEFEPKLSISKEITKRKVVFYDNNLLANPHIEQILSELIELKKEHTILWCESQSGFDGRILLNQPHLASLLKAAGFRYPRIAWDWSYDQHMTIRKQIEILTKASYKSTDVFVFVIYNWDLPFEEMEQKRLKCWEWQVQIADCRYRPLDKLYDYYDSTKANQMKEDYYIHEQAGWTDALVKQFRANVRRQNICVRYGFPFYSNVFERKEQAREIRRQVKFLKTMEEKIRFMEDINADYWIPDQTAQWQKSGDTLQRKSKYDELSRSKPIYTYP